MENKKAKKTKELTELEKMIIMADVKVSKEVDKIVAKHNLKTSLYKRPKGGCNE